MEEVFHIFMKTNGECLFYAAAESCFTLHLCSGVTVELRDVSLQVSQARSVSARRNMSIRSSERCCFQKGSNLSVTECVRYILTQAMSVTSLS